MGLKQSGLAKRLNISVKTYQRKFADDGFTVSELSALAQVLEFRVMLIPLEADVFTAC